MAAAVAKARVQLKYAQARYKKAFDRRLRKGNTEISEGYYVWLEVQDGKSKDKLGGHTEGPYRDLDGATRTFFLQRGDVVERVNSHWVLRATAHTSTSTRGELQATPKGRAEKNREGRS